MLLKLDAKITPTNTSHMTCCLLPAVWYLAIDSVCDFEYNYNGKFHAAAYIIHWVQWVHGRILPDARWKISDTESEKWENWRKERGLVTTVNYTTDKLRSVGYIQHIVT